MPVVDPLNIPDSHCSKFEVERLSMATRITDTNNLIQIK